MGMNNNNLCNSCTNSGCEFQSGIVRTKCAFYMPPHIDSVKQKLLDSLAEEPPMVISTAYAYAKNYVEYGEDVTKAWTTAEQQASILEKARLQAWAEAYDSFKKKYEVILKADMVAILTEIQLECEENTVRWYVGRVDGKSDDVVLMDTINDIIHQKINALEEPKNGR